MYRYELHCHTVETSVCGKWKAEDMVQRYRAQGYTGLCVTDHLHPKFLEKICHGGDWQKCVDAFMLGYRAAKAAGETAGMDILFGIELQFREDPNKEYLLFGVDEPWLRANPWLCDMDHKSFFDKFHEEVLIVQAHPFRDNDGVFLDSVQGIEVVNRHPRSNNRNAMAIALAAAEPWLLRLCGSDAHRFGDEARAAVLLPERVRNGAELRRALLAGNYRLWHDEDVPGGKEYSPEDIAPPEKGR